MTDATEPVPTLVVGLGHVGAHLARTLRGHGIPVCGTVRDPARAAEFEGQGIDVAVCGLPETGRLGEICPEGAAVVHTVPPVGPEARRDAGARAVLDAVADRHPRALVYLSTTGVYAEHDGGEVTEASAVDAGPDRAAARLDAETVFLEGARSLGATGIVLRLAAIYGRGRGLEGRLRAGRVRLFGGGDNLLNRIHVDDLVACVVAALGAGPAASGIYNLADDRPASLREVSSFLAARLGLPVPETAEASEAPSPTLLGSKRVSNAKAKAVLGLKLRYPDYVAGADGP